MGISYFYQEYFKKFWSHSGTLNDKLRTAGDAEGHGVLPPGVGEEEDIHLSEEQGLN